MNESVTIESPCDKIPPGEGYLVEDIFMRLNKDVRDGKYFARTFDGKKFKLPAGAIPQWMQDSTREAHESGKWTTGITLLSALVSKNETIRTYATIYLLDVYCGISPVHYDGQRIEPPLAAPEPSWYWYGTCTFKGPDTIQAPGLTPVSAVQSLDYINRFTVEGAMRIYENTKAKWGGPQTFMALAKAAQMFWPAKAAPVTYGWRQGVKALIVGGLYDGATSFEGSKWMRNGFPDGSLLTWQGIGHGVQTADYDAEGLYKCLAKMDKYLLDPSYMPVDGDTCRNKKVISY